MIIEKSAAHESRRNAGARSKTMCRQKLRNEVPEAGKPALSCLPNRATKVNSQLRYFELFTHEHFLSLCTDCGQSSPVDAYAVCIHQAGSMRSFAFGTWPSHALHQVHKQGCPSSLALSSRGTEAGK